MFSGVFRAQKRGVERGESYECPVGYSLIGLYRYVLPQRVGFWGFFGLKTGIHFAYFGLESGMVM